MKKKTAPQDIAPDHTIQAPIALAPKPDEIQIKNNLNQLVAFNIMSESGRLMGVQIDANSTMTWRKLSNYGPDFDRLMKRKVLRLETGK
jgi:hypothetical protein